MILFRDDWDRYPSAIVDTKTTNQSFVRLSGIYRDMGVKNHTFLLALLNPALQGIDPFDPNLSMEQMAMIALECRENFFYFIREVARAPGVSGAEGQPFRANRGNIALYWLFFNHITTLLIQIRQTGKSFSVSELMSYLLNIRCVNTSFNLLTKDDGLRARSLSMLKDADEEFPFYLKQRTKFDISNTEELTVRSLGNDFKAHLPNRSPKIALNVGRGLTSPIFHVDEFAYIFNIAISLPAALAGGTAARDIARRNDEPYGTLLTTTAGKKDDRDGQYAYRFMSESAVWTEKLFDAVNLDALETLIRKNSPTGKLRVNCTFNHRQLGYTDEWLKRAIEEANAEGEDADRDFFNVWTSGSQSSPLSAELADRIRQSQKPDFRTEIESPYGYITRWYQSAEQIAIRHATSHFILSIDSSDAVGGDDIGLILRDIKTGEVLAAGNYNETNLITFSEWLVSWFTRFQNLTLIIERRSTGAMILDYLLLMLPAKDIDPFKRIYNKAVNEKDEFPERYREISKPLFSRQQDIYIRYKKLFGFATSGTGATSRSELYSTTLINAAKYTGDTVYDKVTIDQILGLIIKNGRVDHAEGEHDDNVIAWLLSAWLLFNGKHLDHYSIDGRLILVNNDRSRNPVEATEQKSNAEQDEIRASIEALVAQLQAERDEFISHKLEIQLRTLASRVKLRDNEMFSIDDLLRNLRDQKRLNRAISNTTWSQPTHYQNSYSHR